MVYIALDVGYDKVDLYLDGKLLMSYTEPQKLFSIAGRDNKTGEIILKVVNAFHKPYKTALQINGAEVNGTGELITLTADSPTSENSLEEPTKYTPQQTTVQGVGSNSEIEFKPYSISILRLKEKKKV